MCAHVCVCVCARVCLCVHMQRQIHERIRHDSQ